MVPPSYVDTGAILAIYQYPHYQHFFRVSQFIATLSLQIAITFGTRSMKRFFPFVMTKLIILWVTCNTRRELRSIPKFYGLPHLGIPHSKSRYFFPAIFSPAYRRPEPIHFYIPNGNGILSQINKNSRHHCLSF